MDRKDIKILELNSIIKQLVEACQHMMHQMDKSEGNLRKTMSYQLCLNAVNSAKVAMALPEDDIEQARRDV